MVTDGNESDSSSSILQDLSDYEDEIIQAANEIFCARSEYLPFDETVLLKACRAGEKYSMWIGYLWWAKGEHKHIVNDIERQSWGLKAWIRGAIEGEDIDWIPRLEELSSQIESVLHKDLWCWLAGKKKHPLLDKLAATFDEWVKTGEDE